MEEEKQKSGEKYKNVYRPLKKVALYNFIGGIAWSLGILVGLTILAVISGFIISKIDLIPIIGSWGAQILENATSKIQPPLSQ